MVMMRVNVGQFKAKLSRYLRYVQEKREPLEVCVREKPVAYLTPIRHEPTTEPGMDPNLVDRLRASGLTVVPPKRPKGDWVPRPGKAQAGKSAPNSVVAMRAEKDW